MNSSDHLGSSSYITDANGEVSQHLEYFAFGETFVEEHSNKDRTPYLYNAKELDEETGLYYYGARYYSPEVSIWLSVDPLWEQVGANRSPYEYTYSNPIRFTDPTGMKPEDGYEDGEGNYVWFDNQTGNTFTDENGKVWSKVTENKEQWDEATTIRNANIEALVELGCDEGQVKKDVRMQGGKSPDFTKHSKLENHKIYTEDWDKALNSEDLLNRDFNKARSLSARQKDVPKSNMSLKFYPDKSGVKDVNALGLVKSAFLPHVGEFLGEITDMAIGKDDFISDMHFDNACNYLDSKQNK